jgi:hypothetical protein
MIYIATHTAITGDADPSLSPEGLRELSDLDNLLMQLDTPVLFGKPVCIDLVGVGTGTRFEQMFKLGMCRTFVHIKPDYFDFISLGVSRRGDRVVTPMGTEVPKRRHHGASDSGFPPDIVWDYFMKKRISRMTPRDQLLCAGRELILSLGGPENVHYNASILEADPRQRTLHWLVKNGHMLDQLEKLPLRIGHRR